MRRLVLALLLTASAAAGVSRQHAVRPPAVSDATPAGWLVNHAYRDLDAIRILIGTSTVIGLGDDTHGTHEFFETKVHMIEELVRDGNFRTVAFEAPFADFTRLNDYVLGGSGDRHAILLHRELGYWMWATDEVVALIDWMRDYNEMHGDRPPIEIAGFDVTDEKGAADVVIAYLESTDPPTAVNASSTYSDCLRIGISTNCQARLNAVRDDLSAREGDLVAHSSQREFDAAAHAASVAAASITQPGLPAYFAWRDQNMAVNLLRLQQRRSSNGRLLVWAHQEHLGKTTNLQEAKPAGKWLEEQFGSNYFVIGTSAGDGTFNVVDRNVVVRSAQFPPISDDSYESSFRSASQPLLIIPLRGELPDWLAAKHHLRGGSSGSVIDVVEDLKQKLDAIIYIDHTTRSANFW